ncbi:MAG: M56 family metallopeptidase [Ruminococcus sp.]|nr:M56 family metallopeptidase [Ruminococcus sp.]
MDEILKYTFLTPERIFSEVIEVTFSIMLIMLAMIIAKKLTRGKLSPKWRYAVWVTAAIRLAIPFNMPFFRLITENTNFPRGSVNLPRFMPVIEVIQPSLDYELPPGAAENWSWGTWEYAQTVDLADYLLPVYIIGVIVYLIWLIGGYISLNRIVKKFGHVPQKDHSDILQTVKVKKLPEIVVCGKISSPMLMGFKHPKIILPHENYTKEEASFIIAHELVHLKRHDLYLKLLIHIITALQWVNPFIYIFSRTVFEDIEITCDSAALEHFNEDQTAAYMRLMARSAAKQKNASLTTSWSGSGKALKRRISENIEKHNDPVVLRALLCSAAVFGAGMFLSDDFGDNAYYYDIISAYPEEKWEYTADESWKTIETDTDDLGELARMALDSYMSRFTGEDVPEYFRVNDYKLLSAEGRRMRGQLKQAYYCETVYDVEYFNTNGNTYHDCAGSFSGSDGLYTSCQMAFKLIKTDNGYLITNTGFPSGGTAIIGGEFHHRQFDNRHLNFLEAMYAAGMFDGDTDFENVSAEKYVDYSKAVQLVRNEDFRPYSPSMFKTKYYSTYSDSEALAAAADNYDGGKYTGSLTEEDIPTLIFDEAHADLEKGVYYRTYIISRDGSPAGNRFTLELSLDSIRNNYFALNDTLIIGFTEEEGRFTSSHKQCDSVTDRDIPYTSPEEYLDWFKTPRDGYAFTVIDYKDISYEEDGVYAYVNYKGTIDGTISACPNKAAGIEQYVRCKLISAEQ